MFCDPGTAGRSFVPTVQKTPCLCQKSSCMIRSVSAAAAIHCYTTHQHYSNASKLMGQVVQMAFWWMLIHRNLYRCQWWVEVWTPASSREPMWSVQNPSSPPPPPEPLYSTDCSIGIWLGNVKSEIFNFCSCSYMLSSSSSESNFNDCWKHQARRLLPFCV
jgi:hypothetical protein